MYPGQPGAAVAAKGNAPCRLECLKVLIGLEEGAHAEGVEEAEEEEHAEDVHHLRSCNLGVHSPLGRIWFGLWIGLSSRTSLTPVPEP